MADEQMLQGLGSIQPSETSAMGLSLRKILREPLTREHVVRVLAELRSDGPRGAAIVGGALIEDALQRLLLVNLPNLSTNGDREGVFGRSGPLATFSAKISVGYGLGLFGPMTRQDLNLVRDIRNFFAHAKIAADFNTPAVASACERFHCLDGPIKSTFAAQPRRRYTSAVKLLALGLLIETQDGLGRERTAASAERSLP